MPWKRRAGRGREDAVAQDQEALAGRHLREARSLIAAAVLNCQIGAEGSDWHARRPLSLSQRAARNHAYRKAASHHAVAVRKFNEATVHLPSRENTARLAFAILSVPSVDVLEVLHLPHVLWLAVEGLCP